MLLSPRPWHSDAVRMWQAIEPTKLMMMMMMMMIIVVVMMMVVMVMTMVNLLPEIGDDIPKVTNQTDKNIEDEPKDDNREEGAIAQRHSVLELCHGTAGTNYNRSRGQSGCMFYAQSLSLCLPVSLLTVLGRRSPDV